MRDLGYAVALGAGLLSLVACGESTPVDTGPDAYVSPPPDAGLPPRDAYVAPPDAAPPVCVGTATPCAAREPFQCAAEDGCYFERCVGTPDRCSRRFDPADCSAVRGCGWVGDDCEGDPEPCRVYTVRTQCRYAGCSWLDSPTECRGTATPCEARTEAECAGALGCALASLPDAGPPDAYVPDAGPTCSAAGCHPLYDADCRCGYSASSFDWACGRSGSGGVGASCDTSAQCGAGLYCSRTTNAARGQCRRLCDEDSDCGAGEGCALIDDRFSCTGYCLPLAECSIVAQDCPGSAGCYYLRDGSRTFTFCNRAGTAEPNDSCYEDPAACIEGYVCGTLLSPMFARCHRACATSDVCPAPETCRGTTGGGEMFCL